MADARHRIVRALGFQPPLDRFGTPPAPQRVHHPRMQPVACHARGLAGLAFPQIGLASGRERGMEREWGPRAGPQPSGPAGMAGFVLVGREPRATFRFPADGRRRTVDPSGDLAHAQPVTVAPLVDTVPLACRQVRIDSTHGCNAFSG